MEVLRSKMGQREKHITSMSHSYSTAFIYSAFTSA